MAKLETEISSVNRDTRLGTRIDDLENVVKDKAGTKDVRDLEEKLSKAIAKKQDSGNYVTTDPSSGKLPDAIIPDRAFLKVGTGPGTAYDGSKGKALETLVETHRLESVRRDQTLSANIENNSSAIREVGVEVDSVASAVEEVDASLKAHEAIIHGNPHKVTAGEVGAYAKSETYNREEVDKKIEESGGGTEKDPVFTEWRNGESVSAGIGAVSSDGVSSVALGSYSTASGGVSVALGGGSSASEEFSVALGSFSTASGKFSVALGSYSTASGKFSVALGSFSTASKENQIAIGSRVECPETADVAIRCGGLDKFTLFNGNSYPTLQSLMDARYANPRYAVVTLEGSSVTLSDRAVNSLALSGGACTVAFPAIPEGYVVDCLLFLPAFKGSLTFPSEARLDDSVGDLAGADGTQDYLLSITSLPDGSYYVTGKVLPKGGV